MDSDEEKRIDLDMVKLVFERGRELKTVRVEKLEGGGIYGRGNDVVEEICIRVQGDSLKRRRLKLLEGWGS